MTLLGKVLVYAILIFSFCALGVTLWTAIDQTKPDVVKKEIESEIQVRLLKRQREALELQLLLNEMAAGTRPILWTRDSTTTEPPRLVPPKPADFIPVRQAKQEITKLKDAVKGLENEDNQLQATRISKSDEVKQQRITNETALAQLKALREEIKPEPPDPAKKAFRDLIEDNMLAKGTAEKQVEDAKPDLFNELARLSLLLQRHEQLQRRLQELRGAENAPRP